VTGDRDASPVKTHKDLDVWREAVLLAEDIYRISRKFPKEEMFGLTSQMRRAAVSIASNIAEGAARSTDRDFRQFLYVAAGSASASELDTHIEIVHRLEMAGVEEIAGVRKRLEHVVKMSQRADQVRQEAYQMMEAEVVAGDVLFVTGFQSQLPIANHQLPITCYQSRITNPRLPITNHQSPVTGLCNA